MPSQKDRERANKSAWAVSRMKAAAESGDETAVENIYQWAQRNKVGGYVADDYRESIAEARQNSLSETTEDYGDGARMIRLKVPTSPPAAQSESPKSALSPEDERFVEAEIKYVLDSTLQDLPVDKEFSSRDIALTKRWDYNTRMKVVNEMVRRGILRETDTGFWLKAKPKPTVTIKERPTISQRAAGARFSNKEAAVRAGRKNRNPELDKLYRANIVAPADAKTPEDLALQKRWFKDPSGMDMEGIDTPPLGQEKQRKPRQANPMRRGRRKL